MASSYKQILDLGLLMDLVLSNRSGFEVRTQKPTSRAELVSDGSNSHELRTKGCTCPLPQPAHPPLFIKKSCLCLSRLSFACYSLRPEKEPPLGFISSLEFLFRILVDEVRTRALMQFKLTSSSDSIINVRKTEQNL